MKGDDTSSTTCTICSICSTEYPQNLITFFVLGLINNFAYVVFLSAAGDILGDYPASMVLLAEMAPIIVAQGVAPLFIERVPFWFRVIIITLTSSAAFVIVAFVTTTELKILGIAIGSVSSGFGEITYMALSSFYHPNTVSMYSSGTGGAGIFGSLAYLALNVWLRVKPTTTLLIMSPVPVLMSVVYFFLLEKEGKPIKTSFDFCSDDDQKPLINSVSEKKQFTVTEKLKLQLPLFQYTGPLFLVYFGEYVINTGITQVLVYPNDPIFAGEEYKYYSFIYQIGVFISRSSANFFQIKYLWLLAFLQIANMCFLGCAAYFNFIPFIWIVFVIIFYEGLIGGAIFVNAFYRVAAEVKEEEKEFCMSSISFWYSIGILLSGVAGNFLQPWLKSVRNLNPVPAPVPMPQPARAPQPQPALAPQPAPMSIIPEPAYVPILEPLPSPHPFIHTPEPTPLAGLKRRWF